MVEKNYYYQDYDMTDLVVKNPRSNGLSMPLRHLHSQYEFLYVKEGQVEVESNAACFTVKSPALVVHKPFSLHRASVKNDQFYDRFVVNISAELLEKIRDLIPHYSYLASSGVTVIPISDVLEEKITNLFQEILWDYEKGNKMRSLLTFAIFLLDVTNHAATCELKSPFSEGYIGEVIKYINERYAEDIMIDELAEYFFVSRSKLISDFKKSVGVSIKKYTLFVKISNAQRFLSEGKRISETASLCGFYDNSHFISTFRSLTGKTPKEYCKSLVK